MKGVSRDTAQSTWTNRDDPKQLKASREIPSSTPGGRRTTTSMDDSVA